jgi:hypothetical protein
MVKLSKKKKIAVAASTIVLAGSGAAYAFVNGAAASSNTGTGSINTGAFTVDDIVTAPFVLDEFQDVSVTVRSPAQKLRVNTVSIIADPTLLTGYAESGCGPVTGLMVTPYTSPAVSIAKGGHAAFVVKVKILHDETVDQSACAPKLKATVNTP